MFESLVCSALRKEGNSGSESHSRGRPDSTTLMGRDLPPHTYISIALGGSMHHHGGTLLCSLCQRSSRTTQLAYGGWRTPRRPVRHTPASPPDYGTSNSLIGGAHSLLVKCRGAMSGYLAS